MSISPPLTIGFVGAGQMASALAKGWISAGLCTPERLLASDPVPAAREAFTKATGAPATPDNVAVARFAQVLVLAVKPQSLPNLLPTLVPHLSHAPLVVSIAAGVPLAKLQGLLGPDCRLIRVMPNTPCLVQASASAWCRGTRATDTDAQWTQQLLGAVGLALELPESQLDAVTGLSGSGPAFACLMIEALADGGVLAGLPRDVAQRLAAQTLLGTARMVLETGKHPGALKDAVASPAGTTIAGLHELERAGVRGALMNAVSAAARRAKELGQG
jgi:pyrroline-5-carboxylate reductase